jgi:ligand-binding sensor domain-containing protein
LWIGASGRGVFGFDGTKFQPVTLNEGHWPNDVRTICEDHEGNLWLGISDGVLAQLRPQRFALLTGAHGLPAGAATCLMPMLWAASMSAWIRAASTPASGIALKK